jgi:hypothetical protein
VISKAMNSFETLEARLQAIGYGSAIENLARMALTKEYSKTVRIGCPRALAQYYPLPGGARPTQEALSAFLEQLDAADCQEREETG